jgi:sporulation protein YlmC with PRC-barrel domain
MNGQANWVRVSWMAVALLPLVAGIAAASNMRSTQPQTNQPIQPDQQVAPTPGQTAQFVPKLERAKNLIGAKIVDEKGERLGTVADIVLTPNRDAVSYVVLSHGGTWGMGDKYFAVPWSQFSFRPGETAGQGILVLKTVTNADLDRAPGFDKNNWPTVANENWLGIERGSAMAPSGGAAAPAPRSSVEERAPMATEPRSDQPMATEPRSERDESAAPGMTPERGMRADTGYSAAKPADIEHLRLSKLMGNDIRNLQNENLGKLDNVVIDLNQGKLAYGIVAVRSGFLGLNKDFVAVPWSALNWTAQPGIARLDANKETLTAIAFDKDHFPNLADPQYSRQLYERFHATPYWEGQNLGFIPGEENRGVKPPSSGEMKAPNSADVEQINHKEKHALSYNPEAVQTIHGTVQSVGSYRIEGTSVHGVLLHVRTDDGRMVSVQAGPRPYVDSQNIRFNKGDPVTITGSVAKVGERETILASRIQVADKALALRAPDGRPLWNLEQYREPARAGGYSHGY